MTRSEPSSFSGLLRVIPGWAVPSAARVCTNPPFRIKTSVECHVLLPALSWVSLPPSASKRSALLARSVHPLSWASLPPPAKSLSIPHKCSLHPLSWASPPPSCKPSARLFRTLSWASLPPPPSSGSTPLTHSVHPLSGRAFRPQLPSYPCGLRLSWGRFPPSQLALPSTPEQARDRHPLPTACSPSAERGNRLGQV